MSAYSSPKSQRYCSLCRDTITVLFAKLNVHMPDGFAQQNITPEVEPRPDGLYEGFVNRAKQCDLCRLLLKTLQRNGHFKAFKRGIQKQPGPGADLGAVMYDENGVSDHDRNVDRLFVRIGIGLRKEAGRYSELVVNFGVSARSRYRQKARIDVPERVLMSVSYASPSVPIRPDCRLGSAQRLESLRDWLDIAPGPASQPPIDRLPGRIIEVSGLVDMRVRLITVPSWFPENPGDRLEYVALSHRWGKIEQCITTNQNVTERMVWFPASKLPQTFVDACFVTACLGFRYLWIDALCILQDVPEDWDVESLKMGDVFQAAQVVIAAHGAHDAAEGFLEKALRLREEDEATLLTEPVVSLRLRPNFDADVVRSHLSMRGWVMQERMLATRTLHFAQGHIYLESPRGVWIEGDSEASALFYGGAQHFSDGKTMTGAVNQLLHPDTFPRTAAAPEILGLGSDNLSTQWASLIQLYSSCGLTKEEDKLIAISGIANAIHRIIGGFHFAGLWSHCLTRGLLWIRQSEQLTFPARRRAPSWSWASVDGPVQYPAEAHSDKCVAECSVFVQDDPFATIATVSHWLQNPPSITLQGHMVNLGPYLHNGSNPCHNMPVWLSPHSRSNQQHHTYGWSLPIPTLQHPVLRFGVVNERAAHIDRDEVIIGWFSLDNHTRRGEGETEVEETLRTWDENVLFAQVVQHADGMSLGILLAPCKGKYVRIGTGQLRYIRFEWEVKEVEII